MVEIHRMFITIAALLVTGQLLVLLCILKNQFVFANRFLIYVMSVIPVLVAFQLGMLNGTVIDELGIGGKPLMFFLLVAMIILGVDTLWVSFTIASKIEKTAVHSKTLE